jgi:hypothetical protein
MAKKSKKSVSVVVTEPIANTKEIQMTTKRTNALSDSPIPAPFTFEFVDGRNDLALLRVAGDEDKAPFYTEGPNRVHGLCNAMTHIWLGTYPVFEPGYFYFRQSCEEARKTLGVENLGYIRGGERLAAEVGSGSYSHTKPIVSDAIYRAAWNGHRFTLQIVEWHSYEAEEPNWIKHDRDALRLIEGLDDVYRAVELKQAIRMFFVESVQWALAEKKNQMVFVANNDVDGLRTKMNNGIKKTVAYQAFKEVASAIKAGEAATEKGEKPPKAYTNIERSLARKLGMVSLYDGGEIADEELIGKKIQYFLGGQAIPGMRVVTTENFPVIIRLIARQGYRVALVQ